MIICFSCFKPESITIKYREKNPITELTINSSNGNIDILGWPKNFIEIIGNKKLISGISSDLKQMNINFSRTNQKFIITTKIPSRLNGKIDLLINIPYSLLTIDINSDTGNINIERYLGNLLVNNKSGNIIFDFYGNFLRINTDNSKIKFNILGNNFCDVYINNESGNTSCDLINSSADSYLDIITNNGNINLNISKKNPHLISSISKKYMLNIDYNVDEKIYAKGSYNFLKANFGNSKRPIKINLTNLNGYTIIHKLE